MFQWFQWSSVHSVVKIVTSKLLNSDPAPSTALPGLRESNLLDTVALLRSNAEF